MADLIYEEESYQIRGAIYDVYNELGCGFLEGVYQEALSRELSERNIPFIEQKELYIVYKGRPLNQTFKADMVCHDLILIELKALKALNDQHLAQVMNYLKASGLRLGLLVNFGAYPKVEIRRVVV
ncbi:MAG: GxxExxY protein [Candidatus Sumerlaeia bacterium]|nr:GxxExxY protein [Candidatus Sumerlaeia bacterium]